MREVIDFEIVDFRNFDSLVTLTLTFDDLETYIVRFVSSTSIHSIIEHVAPLSFIVNGRTYVRLRESQVMLIWSSHFWDDLIKPDEMSVRPYVRTK